MIDQTVEVAFEPFPKIPRFEKFGVTITEKIDGTNAQIFIDESATWMKVGSRSRWLSPGKETDNFGFAAWCMENRDELLKLGPGRHFGEWWGSGIQRGYGLTNGERRFSLFNTSRPAETLPACVSQVPVLYQGAFDERELNSSIGALKQYGSFAVPGFMNPEGTVIYFHQTRSNSKYIISGEKPSKEFRRKDDLLPIEVNV